MAQSRRVAIITVRYGEDVIGGAEAHARALAEHLVRDRNDRVTVFTTNALDYRTWASELPLEEEVLNGVKVRRFPIRGRRKRLLMKWTAYLIRWLSWSSRLRSIWERLWFHAQGPETPELLEALEEEKDQFDMFVFMSYLYYPTIFGLNLVPRTKTILVPTAHDEPAFYFEHVRTLFASGVKIFANSQAEYDLILKNYPQAEPWMHIVGVGVDVRDDEKTISSVTLESPYILYLGRLSRGKGVDVLMRAFADWKRQNPNTKCELHLAGQREDDLNLRGESFIKYRGILNNKEKVHAIRNAAAIVNPSAFESLSMVVLESLALGRPVIVNENSPVLRGYKKVSSTVLGYKSEQELAQCLTAVVDDNWRKSHAAEGLNGARWVEEHYGWKRIIAAYDS